MVRNLETFRDKADSVILEVRQPIGHQCVRYSEGGAPLDDCRDSVFRVGAWKTEKPLLIRRVVSKHQNILVVVLAWPEVDAVELDEVVRLRAMDGRAEWTCHLLPFDRGEAMDAATDKGADVCGQRGRLELGSEDSLRCIATTVAGGTSVCDDAQLKLKVGSVLEYPDIAIRISPKVVGGDQHVRAVGRLLVAILLLVLFGRPVAVGDPVDPVFAFAGRECAWPWR